MKKPDEQIKQQAKDFAKMYPYNFISAVGLKFGGFHFIPGCFECESPRLKLLKGPFTTQDGKTYAFECQDCKKPVDYTAVYV